VGGRLGKSRSALLGPPGEPWNPGNVDLRIRTAAMAPGPSRPKVSLLVTKGESIRTVSTLTYHALVVEVISLFENRVLLVNPSEVIQPGVR
jgi:hypothetical protein